jgi:hypothetical protein
MKMYSQAENDVTFKLISNILKTPSASIRDNMLALITLLVPNPAIGHILSQFSSDHALNPSL